MKKNNLAIEDMSVLVLHLIKDRLKLRMKLRGKKIERTELRREINKLKYGIRQIDDEVDRHVADLD